MGWDKLSVIGVSTDLKIVQRSSSPTAKKTLPVIVRIYLFFFTAHVHVYPQIAFPRKFKVALVTQLYKSDFSPLCVLKYFFQALVREKTKSHWLHLYDFFSSVCS
jgi:hypothetical protein